LIAPELINEVLQRIEKNKDLTYYAVNKTGELKTNVKSDGPNAVTWGIFPNREIVQPTIVETISFLAWKDEAYRLGDDWAHCHTPESPSRKLIAGVMDDWYLVNIVNNDFHQTHTIFDIFKDLSVEHMNQPISNETVTNQHANNAAHEADGHLSVRRQHETIRDHTLSDAMPIRRKAEPSPLRN